MRPRAPGRRRVEDLLPLTRRPVRARSRTGCGCHRARSICSPSCSRARPIRRSRAARHAISAATRRRSRSRSSWCSRSSTAGAIRGRATRRARRSAISRRVGRCAGCATSIVDGADKRVGARAGRSPRRPRLAAWLLGSRDSIPSSRRSRACSRPTSRRRARCRRAGRAACWPRSSGGTRLLDLAGTAAERPRAACCATRRSGAERPLLVVNGRGLGADRLVAAFREATLHGALLAFTRRRRGARAATRGARSASCLRRSRHGRADRLPRDACRALVDDAPDHRRSRSQVPPFDERASICGAATSARQSRSTETELQRIAALYNLGVGGIVNASARRARGRRRSRASRSTRRTSRARCASCSTPTSRRSRARVEVTQTWDDLVLPEDVGESVRRHRRSRRSSAARCSGDWGFARKVGKGLGPHRAVLGPARHRQVDGRRAASRAELGLDLYVIDLSQHRVEVARRDREEPRARVRRRRGRPRAAAVRRGRLAARQAHRASPSRPTIATRTSRPTTSSRGSSSSRASRSSRRTSRRRSIPRSRAACRCTSQFPFPDVEIARPSCGARMIPAEAPVAADDRLRGARATLRAVGRLHPQHRAARRVPRGPRRPADRDGRTSSRRPRASTATAARWPSAAGWSDRLLRGQVPRAGERPVLGAGQEHVARVRGRASRAGARAPAPPSRCSRPSSSPGRPTRAGRCSCRRRARAPGCARCRSPTCTARRGGACARPSASRPRPARRRRISL